MAEVGTELGIVDPSSAAFWQDVHGVLAPLREQAPVARSTISLYEVLRYEHCEPLLRDPSLHQALQGMLAHQGIDSGPLFEWWQLIMNNHDAPTHTRLRSLVSRAFTPRQVNEIRPRIRALANELVKSLAGAGEVDLLTTYCHDLPLVVLCDMLGVPASDYRVVEQWTTLVALSFSPVIPAPLVADIDRAVLEFSEYADGLIESCRSTPRDDLLTALVHAEESGDRLSRDELKALIINILFAGHDTTKSMLGIGIWLLASHPDQLAEMRSDPALVLGAVEEIARYETPISGIPRITTKAMTIGGFPVPAGSHLSISVPSANRDGRRFTDPDRFDISRREDRHLTFGFGLHHCVGASVARAEVQEALSVLFSRADVVPTIDEPTWVPFAAARRYESLPATVSMR